MINSKLPGSTTLTVGDIENIGISTFTSGTRGCTSCVAVDSSGSECGSGRVSVCGTKIENHTLLSCVYSTYI